jgi:type IV pilus assembly protein PilC
MKFKYQAINREGERQKGIVETLSSQAAERMLVATGLTSIELKELKPNSIEALTSKVMDGVKPREFVIFSRQLATLIDSKVPLLAALDSISNQTENKFFSLKLKSVMFDIDGGSSLSEALGKHPDMFSNFYVSMVKAGEASGTLQESLNKLADNIERNYELTSSLKGAMYYPAFIIVAMIGVGGLMMVTVVPKLLEILREAGEQLPLQTRILIWTSDFMVNYWWAVIIMIIAGIFSVVYYLKTDGGKKQFDQLVLKVPVIGKILHNVYIARFSENLGTLLQSGLPIRIALSITADVVGNSVYKYIIDTAADEIKKGGNLSTILGKYEEIPPVMTQMVEVGEHTGRMSFSLGKITEFYMKESDRMVKNFSTLIEPILMVFLAIGVGILVSAILLPIYQVAMSIK